MNHRGSPGRPGRVSIRAWPCAPGWPCSAPAPRGWTEWRSWRSASVSPGRSRSSQA